MFKKKEKNNRFKCRFYMYHYSLSYATIGNLEHLK